MIMLQIDFTLVHNGLPSTDVAAHDAVTKTAQNTAKESSIGFPILIPLGKTRFGRTQFFFQMRVDLLVT